MARKKQNTPTDADDEQGKLDRAMGQCRAWLAKKLPAFTNATLSAGVGVTIAGVLAALATSPDQAAVQTLMTGLGVNWLSQIVLDMRAKAKQMSAEQVARDAGPQIEAQLTDARLRGLMEQLDVLAAVLPRITDDAARSQFASNAVERGLVTQEMLRDALKRTTVKVHLSVGGDMIDSVALVAGRSIQISHSSIVVNGARRDLTNAIATAKNDMADTLNMLPLRGVDLQWTRGNAFWLADTYTPLYTPAPQARQWDRQASDEDAMRAQMQRGEDASRQSLIDALNDHPRAVILGGPGCGKSTVLSYLAVGLCGRVKDFDQQWKHGDLLPIHVTLRHFARQLRNRAQHDGKPVAEPCRVLIEFVQERLGRYAPELAANLNDVLAQRGAVWLLDGLDEVPASPGNSLRKQVTEAIRKLVALYPRCRYVVTCRTYSYRTEAQKIMADGAPAFAELPTLPLADEEIALFVNQWYAEAALKRNVPNGNTRAQQLIEAIRRKKHLRRLADNPLLLTLAAALHSFDNRSLPEDRVTLFERAVELLLGSWQSLKYDQEDDAYDAGRERAVLTALDQRGMRNLTEALARLAYDAHKEATLPDEDATADVSEDSLRRTLREFLTKGGLGEDLTDADLTLYLRDRAGLLIDDGEAISEGSLGDRPHVYRFPHRMFQEYLAAMAKQNKPREVRDQIDGDYARWNEVFALIALMGNELTTASCVNLICKSGAWPGTSAEWRRALLAGWIWVDRQVSDETIADVDEVRDSVAHVRECLVRMMADTRLVAPRERSEAGRALVQLPNDDPVRFTCADHRLAACANLLTSEGLAEYLDSGFARIEPAEFIMQQGEVNAGKARVPGPYRIGRTPVTYAQFEAFVRAPDGYREDGNWTEAGRQWRRERSQPYLWDKLQWHIANHPVVGVTWYESAAFCRWLTRRIQGTGHRAQTVSLPTEVEWEFAARRGTGRQYPWKSSAEEGWAEGDELRCNVEKSGIGRTSAVGIFPDGATPDGICDLSGDVWEWVLTVWNDDWRRTNQREEGESTRGVRGGSWANSDPAHARLGRRFRYLPSGWFDLFGFRVVDRAYSYL